jgi:hypothetical protein
MIRSISAPEIHDNGGTNVSIDNNLIDVKITGPDEYEVADIAADVLARLHTNLEPELYQLAIDLGTLADWAANHDLEHGVLRGVADLALGQVLNGHLARQIRDIAATLPDHLG